MIEQFANIPPWANLQRSTSTPTWSQAGSIASMARCQPSLGSAAHVARAPTASTAAVEATWRARCQAERRAKEPSKAFKWNMSGRTYRSVAFCRYKSGDVWRWTWREVPWRNLLLTQSRHLLQSWNGISRFVRFIVRYPNSVHPTAIWKPARASLQSCLTKPVTTSSASAAVIKRQVTVVELGVKRRKTSTGCWQSCGFMNG